MSRGLQAEKTAPERAKPDPEHPESTLAASSASIEDQRLNTGGYRVSLPMFEERCRNRGIQAPPMDDLKQLLRSSKSRRFLAAKNVKTRLENKVIHCWVFAQPADRNDASED